MSDDATDPFLNDPSAFERSLIADEEHRIVAVQRYLADEREAGRWVVDLSDAEVIRILAAADAAERRRHTLQQALDLLRDLRDCPLTDLERRQEEIDRVIEACFYALR